MRPWLRRVLRGLALSLLLAMTLLSSALFWLLDTTSGFHWLVRQASPYLPVAITLQGTEGNLWQGLRFQELQVRAKNPGLGFEEIIAKQLAFRWQPSKLVQLKVDVSRFSAEELAITLAEPQRETSNTPLALPSVTLPVGIAIGSLDIRSLHIARQNTPLAQVSNIAVSAKMTGSRITARKLAATFQEEQYRLEGNVDFAPQWQFNLNLVSHHLTTNGECITERPVECSLRVQWQDLSHAQVPQAESPDGELDIQLTTQTLSAKGRAALITTAMNLDLSLDTFTDFRKGESQVTHFSIHPESGGQVTGDALLQWADALSIRAQLTADTLNLQPWLGQQFDTAELSASATGEFHYSQQTPSASIQLTIDALNLGKNPLAGEISGTLQNQQVQLAQLQLSNTANTLSAKGHYHIDSQALGLDISADARDLNAIANNLTGRARLSSHIEGDASAPNASLEFHGEQLAYSDLQVEALDLTIAAQKLQLAAPEKIKLTNLQLSVQQLVQQQPLVEQARLTASGSAASHQLTLSVSGLPGGIDIPSLAVTGQLEKSGAGQTFDPSSSTWALMLEKLDLDTGVTAGRWHLDAPAPIRLSQQNASASDVCLARNDARLCLARLSLKAMTEAELAVRIDSIHLDRERTPFQHYLQRLPTAWQTAGALSGRLDASATLQDFKPETFTLAARVGLSDAGIFFRSSEQPDLDLPIHDTEVVIEGNQEEVRLNAQASLGEEQLSATGTLTQLLQQRPGIDLRLDGTLTTLAYIQPFVPSVAELEGKGSINLHYLRPPTASDAELTGVVGLREFGLIVPQTGTRIRQWTLDLDATPTAIALRGQGNVGEGTMNLKGDVEPIESGRFPFQARVRLEGEQLKLVDQPDANLIASPDLTLEGEDLNWHLSGRVAVRDSFYHLSELPKSASNVSDDAVIYGEQAPEETSPLVLTSDIAVILGDSIRFEGFGLKTDIRGDLNFNQDSSGRRQLHGSLNLPNGQYKSYGQDLKIENGQIVFTGSLDNPNLNVRAARTIERRTDDTQATQVKAGIWLYGSAKNPKTQLYSTPSMSESDILSYMLTGKPMEEVGKGEGGQAEAAALSMGLAQALPTLQRLGGELGLTDVTIDSDSATGTSSVGAGKQLSDKLYVKYQYGLVGAVGRFILEYSLTRQLKVEAASGDVRTVDLTYTWDSKPPKPKPDDPLEGGSQVPAGEAQPVKQAQ